MFNENNYPDDEYVNDENDSEKVVIIPDDDYVILDNEEETVEFDEVVGTIQGRSQIEMEKSDLIQEKKVLNSLRKGKFR